MTAVVPHLKFPPQLASDGHLQAVEQDSYDDILGCVYVALKTQLGTRLYVPDFGITDYTFIQAPIPNPQLYSEIRSSEPRATVDLSEQVDDLIETVVVGVNNVG